jgi:hypothetical protein
LELPAVSSAKTPGNANHIIAIAREGICPLFGTFVARNKTKDLQRRLPDRCADRVLCGGPGTAITTARLLGGEETVDVTAG